MDDSARYWAFLSYSHKDRQFAGWLHRALESYTIPSALVGTIGTNGEIPKKLAPIFRDREELAASASLGDRLREAIVKSRFLIVVCSPTAAISKWTNEEIATFKRSHGGARILAAIISGEPNATDMPGREGEECFPPALRFQLAADGSLTDIPSEPIAADFRAEGDGKRLAKLKLIAGMLGVPLDTLVQREAQRRNRRLAWLSAASVAGMAVTSGLAIAAIQARDEARFQRGEAAGLVEYMLTDLRKKLEPVGRLEVLDGVGQRALAYYEKQDVSQLSADELGQRAKALNLVGEVRSNKGDLDGALVAFREAARTTREQLARAPDDPQRYFDHSQAAFWVGQVAYQRDDFETAAQSFDDYLAMATWLTRRDPSNKDWQLEYVYALNSVAAVEQAVDKDREALSHYAVSEKTLRQIGATDPKNRDLSFALAQVLAWSSKSYASLGNPRQALARRQEEVRVYSAMLKVDPKDFTPLASQLVAEGQVARNLLWMGDVSGARKVLIEAQPAEAKLLKHDPSNTIWRESAARYWLLRAEAALASEDLRDARLAVDKAESYCGILVQSDAATPDWNYDCVAPAMWLGAALANHRGDADKVERVASQFRAKYNGKAARNQEGVRLGNLVLASIDRVPGNAKSAENSIRSTPFKDQLRQDSVDHFMGSGGDRASAYPFARIVGPKRSD